MTSRVELCRETLFVRSRELEVVTPNSTHALCFRYVPQKLINLADSEVDTLNREILDNLGDSCAMFPLGMVSNGRFVLTVAITKHGPQFPDLELLAREVLYYGRRIMSRRTGVALG